MTCEACITDVTNSLYALEGKDTLFPARSATAKCQPSLGIDSVDANLQDQIVAVEGTGEAQSIGENGLK